MYMSNVHNMRQRLDALRRAAGVIDDMQFSTAIARTYYRNILQQLEQSEA